MEVKSGYYEFTPPKASVYLKVKPAVIGANKPDQTRNVDIAINDLRAIDKLAGIEWKLRFDKSLLEVINVTEGDFLKSQAEKAKNETGEDYGAYFVWSNDTGPGFVLGSHLYYKDPWPPAVFPEGSGTLATITFKVIKIPEQLTQTDLSFFGVAMYDVDENQISYDRVENGKFLVPVEKGDLNYDRKINLQDIFIFAKAFGSYPGHSRWDPVADINGDDKVSLLDGIIIARAFHLS